MKNKIKFIIFDWGGTLHDPMAKELFPGTVEVLDKLSKAYTLALVSLAKSQPYAERMKSIEENGIVPYFKKILVDEEDKDDLYEKLVRDFNMKPENIAVVDDRTIRGIAWGNRRGTMTVWVKRGRFANELPNEITGEPTHTIEDLNELLAGGIL
jgi:FMN phosphatase YigB (HAD superfamily)